MFLTSRTKNSWFCLLRWFVNNETQSPQKFFFIRQLCSKSCLLLQVVFQNMSKCKLMENLQTNWKPVKIDLNLTTYCEACIPLLHIVVESDTFLRYTANYFHAEFTGLMLCAWHFILWMSGLLTWLQLHLAVFQEQLIGLLSKDHSCFSRNRQQKSALLSELRKHINCKQGT